MNEINRELAGLLGLCWHENEIWPCSVGSMRMPCSKCGSADYNPNFTTDSGKIELLRLMMKRWGEWDCFASKVGIIYYTRDGVDSNGGTIESVHFATDNDYILDTTGLLAQAAVEFLRREKYEPK